MNKKVISFIIATFLFTSIIGIAGFSFNSVCAINDDPVIAPNQGSGPFPPLNVEEKILRSKKISEYRRWLSKQPKDINPIDLPIPSLKPNNSTTFQTVNESKEISIPLRMQERSYWCGPASAQEVLDYDWGYLSTVSKYSQAFLANAMGTNPVDGTYVYRLKDALDKYRRSNFWWVYHKLSSDETSAAIDLYNRTKFDIYAYEGLVYHTNTYPFYGYDAWGERYGLIGYYDKYNSNYHRTYHYVVGYGYIEESTGRHRVMYLDSNSSNYGWGTPLGRHTVDARNMAECVIHNAGYIIW